MLAELVRKNASVLRAMQGPPAPESSPSAVAAPSLSPFVAQHYLRHPLLVHGRKFDIRQWVLLTSLRPLTAWTFPPYLRFCAVPYTHDERALADPCDPSLTAPTSCC